MAGKNIPGYCEFLRIAVTAESADGLLKLRDSFLRRTPRGPGTRKTDGCTQPEHARLLLPCRRDGGFKFTDRFFEVRGIEPQQTFRAQPINFRKKESDTRLLDSPQNHIQWLERSHPLSILGQNIRHKTRVEWRERSRHRNPWEFRFHYLEAAGEIVAACTGPP